MKKTNTEKKSERKKKQMKKWIDWKSKEWKKESSSGWKEGMVQVNKYMNGMNELNEKRVWTSQNKYGKKEQTKKKRKNIRKEKCACALEQMNESEKRMNKRKRMKEENKEN